MVEITAERESKHLRVGAENGGRRDAAALRVELVDGAIGKVGGKEVALGILGEPDD